KWAIVRRQKDPALTGARAIAGRCAHCRRTMSRSPEKCCDSSIALPMVSAKFCETIPSAVFSC
ncbi:unnamed protein product, partial [Nesidiocoris tenuis]